MGAAGVADARQSAARRRQPERQTGGANVAGGTGRWRTPRTTRSRGARRAGRGEHVLTAGAHVGGLACGDRERGVRQRRGEARGLTSVDGERGRRGVRRLFVEEDEDGRSGDAAAGRRGDFGAGGRRGLAASEAGRRRARCPFPIQIGSGKRGEGEGEPERRRRGGRRGEGADAREGIGRGEILSPARCVRACLCVCVVWWRRVRETRGRWGS